MYLFRPNPLSRSSSAVNGLALLQQHVFSKKKMHVQVFH